MRLRIAEMCGWKVSIDSSWKLEISSTTQVSGEDCSTKVMAGVPMFPPTSVLRPPEAMISPVSVVVVVLPLEPVMATIVSLQEARGQLDFADDRNAEAARVLQRSDIAGNAGAYHNQILIAEGALAVLAGFHRNAAVEQRRNFVAAADPRSWHR